MRWRAGTAGADAEVPKSHALRTKRAIEASQALGGVVPGTESKSRTKYLNNLINLGCGNEGYPQKYPPFLRYLLFDTSLR